MKIELLDKEFCVCKLNNIKDADVAAEFVFFAKTDSELSLVCLQENAPKNAAAIDSGWKALRIVGQLDFSLIGVLSKLSGILAEKQIPVFVVSTYDTDYILIKNCYIDKAIAALKERGYEFR